MHQMQTIQTAQRTHQTQIMVWVRMQTMHQTQTAQRMHQTTIQRIVTTNN